ncbi:D-alanine--D-alanine ligase [Candidatus Aminicenantes bacterium AC-708-M15]|jgi:D-alanine-D-alanine ligase|nr:D-alanine--D-alanine ligase [SCandidatus Aminicenantes bacterium Aminicenantia_JdfR_composite]MCP2597944.1 D-alanine--D-alanine ligase [Candidatus Aminicenantes bacterium AC-335-L06]MCP2598982.1 D-alanine--D-alanine ligase [Candidatus Aminicenantes bacterium AC-335-B20]MCP2604309.1 D-alanine--D-alanine ligase [Candidatus Aminicenantes bacterium AC-708-M15]MCP2606074.1 D-alanine--D-alanine ligase [Candidatus Aminicenantes bacterium AC-708-I09]MCP2618543.1 D-alanine--D-alanine ligase [Candida
MKSGKIKIGLIFGGRSAEHEISILSASSVYKNINKEKFEVISIYINKNGYWRVVDSPLIGLENLNKGEFYSFLPWADSKIIEHFEADVYFPLLHGPYGEDGTIQGLLEMANVPYVGAGVLASSLGMDKAKMKFIFRAKGLPVVNFIIIHDWQWKKDRDFFLKKIKEEFKYPIFTKPSNLGSSIGITKVKEETQLIPSIEQAFKYDRKILVEQGVIAREIECSVLGNEEPQASLPGELIPYREFYDYRDKYVEGKTEFKIPAPLEEDQIKEIRRLAIEAFKAIECEGMARVDFFLEKETDKIFINEINTIPGFTEISMYPKMWEASGISYPKLIEILIELALERYKNKK